MLWPAREPSKLGAANTLFDIFGLLGAALHGFDLIVRGAVPGSMVFLLLPFQAEQAMPRAR